jgi:predicted ABC-type ATPase
VRLESDTPELLIVVGPNGSGKSSLVAETGINEGLPIINPDIVATELFSNIEDENERNMAAWKKCNELRELKLGARDSFGFETVGSHISKVAFIKQAKELGYVVSLIFVSTENPDINIRRIAHRVQTGGHGIPDDKVRSRYARTMSLLPEYFNQSDVASIWDNSIDTDTPDCPRSRLLVKKTPDAGFELFSASQKVNWIQEFLLNPLGMNTLG